MLLHINISYNYACAPGLLKLHTIEVKDITLMLFIHSIFMT